MKQIFTAILLMATLTASARVQFPLNQYGEVEYTQVIQAPNFDKDQIYSQAREWMAVNFNSAQDVIQMDDREAGKIISKGIVNIPNHTLGHVNFTLEIHIRDGRFRYSINHIRHQLPAGSLSKTPGVLTADRPGGGMFTMGRKWWDKIKELAHTRFRLIELDLLDLMSEVSDTEDDW